jgi:hypothetical protein
MDADAQLDRTLGMGNVSIFDELEDWLSGALGCENSELISEACYGMY